MRPGAEQGNNGIEDEIGLATVKIAFYERFIGNIGISDPEFKKRIFKYIGQ